MDGKSRAGMVIFIPNHWISIHTPWLALSTSLYGREVQHP
jgi:hypothetical protein